MKNLITLHYSSAHTCNCKKIKNLIDIGFDGVTISSAIYNNSLDLNEIKNSLSKIYTNINFNLNDEQE